MAGLFPKVQRKMTILKDFFRKRHFESSGKSTWERMAPFSSCLVLLHRVLSLFSCKCARWLSKVASAIHSHLLETQSITYLIILGTGEKTEAWACESFLCCS